MTREHAYSEIAAIEGVALMLADATSRETELADLRSLEKDAAIRRLMSAGTYTSVTAAEKFVEADPQFLKYRETERHAVAARIVLQGKLEAAKLRARLAVECVALDEPLVEAETGEPWFDGKVKYGHVDVPDGFEEGDTVRVERIRR